MSTEIEAKAAHRRAYKRRWMAKRRAAIKAERGEEVRLFLSRQLAADLRRIKPKQFGFRQWLVMQLRQKVAKAAGPEPAGCPASMSGADRNRPCPCGCGRKAKHCQGAARL